MTGVAYVAATVLAAVFGWAAVAKLRAGAATAAGFAGLGLPAPQLLARLVPAAELVLAAALVLVPAWGAAAALVLLAAFTGVLVVNLGRGATGCNCFGSRPRAGPVSGIEVVRNLLLAAGAVVATGAAGPRVPGLTAVVATVMAVVLGAAALRVLRLLRSTEARSAGTSERPQTRRP